MASEIKGEQLDGTVEVDGAYFGGYIQPANEKKKHTEAANCQASLRVGAFAAQFRKFVDRPS